MGNQRIRTARARMVSCAAVLAVLLAAEPAAGATGATGAQPRPRYDPDSSAGKEYALPLAQAREQAGGAPPASRGGGGAGAGKDGDALFGDGITPARERGSTPPAGAGTRSPTLPQADAGSARPGPAAEPAERVSTSPAGISGVLMGALSGAVVVLLAGALIFVLRRSGGTSSTA